MISLAGVGFIVRFHGNINASIYKELLYQRALPHLRKETVETPIFMQDNALCHKAKTLLSFLEEEGIYVIKWPPQSPDINPIENVRKIIGEKAQNRNPPNMDDLWGWDIGLMSRVFSSDPGDQGSISGRVIPKTQKTVLGSALLSTQHYKVRIKGKVKQSWEWSSALTYTMV